MVKVSICIPTYNNDQAVSRLLESVEIQTYKDFEVIITDDSEDNSIAELCKEKSYVQYYKNVKRLGSTANWNETIKKSCGEYIKIMHHDDWFTDENSLQEFVDMLDSHPEADMAFCGTRQVEGQNVYERFTCAEDVKRIRENYHNLYLGNTIGAPSAVIVRRNRIDSGYTIPLLYDERLTWLVDMEYYMRLLKNNSHFEYTEKPLISIGVSSGQLTEQCRDDHEVNVFEYGYIYDKFKLHEKPYRNKLMRIYADAGKTWIDIEKHGITKKEYGRTLATKIISKIEWKLFSLLNEKYMALLLILFSVASLVPIFMLSKINQATGDDLGYGTLTHAAWISTHSIVEVIKAACETVVQYYHGWQGTWLSIFLFSFQPEVFSPTAYIIVPFMMLAIFILSTGLLLHYLLVKLAGFDKYTYLILFLLLVIAGIQFVPSTKSGIFWYNGTAHYVIPYSISLLCIYFFLKFMNDMGIGAYIGLLIGMFLLGGVNYQAALFAPIVILLLCPVFFIWKSRKKVLACTLPLLLEGAGLIVSMKSPGNKARGGADFGFHMGHAFQTILQCFLQGTVQIAGYIMKHPLLLLIFVTAVFFLFKMFAQQKSKKKYPYPALFIFFSYCVYCAMYAPQIYAGVEVSGGVHNMNYYVFLLMVFGSLTYLSGWLSYRYKDSHRLFKKVCVIPYVLIIMSLLIFFRSSVKETTAYLCIDFMSSGRAADYKKQMEEQKELLLDNNRKSVVVPAMNDDQGPLMHMPITESPDNWTNTITRDFYQKDSVIAIPREEWEAQYEKEMVQP